MRPSKRKNLEAKGWRVRGADELLGLTAEEAAYLELKVKLAIGLRERREKRAMTQAELSALIQSSQSRVAKMEAGDPSVSVDLLLRSLLALGATSKELARLIGRERT